MHKMLDDFADVAAFAALYIVEAHAVDEWPVGDVLQIKQPVTDDERCSIARSFIKQYELRMPTLVDTISNSFNTAFAAWPIRFYVIQDGLMRYIAQPDTHNTYDAILPELRQFLTRLCRDQPTQSH